MSPISARCARQTRGVWALSTSPSGVLSARRADSPGPRAGEPCGGTAGPFGARSSSSDGITKNSQLGFKAGIESFESALCPAGWVGNRIRLTLSGPPSGVPDRLIRRNSVVRPGPVSCTRGPDALHLSAWQEEELQAARHHVRPNHENGRRLARSRPDRSI